MSLPLDRAPIVFVVDHDIEPYQAGSLYRSADCVVLVGRSSEPGPAAVEALACGVPLVTVDWGGASELVDGVGVVGVESVLVPSSAAGLQWADPYYGKMREALRKMYTDAEAANAQALTTSERLRTELSWDSLAKKMIERLDKIARG